MSRAEPGSAALAGGGVAPPRRAAAGTVSDRHPDDPRGNRTERFVELSAFLTGYGRVRLIGTGLSAVYLRTLEAALPAGVLGELLDAFEGLPTSTGQPNTGQPGTGPSSTGQEEAAAAAIFDDAKLGPVARNLILLWYCGTWTALGEDWHSAYGAAPARDADPGTGQHGADQAGGGQAGAARVVSAAAYQGGLQWAAAGAHPPGARQQGFGAWAEAPEAPEVPEAPEAREAPLGVPGMRQAPGERI